MKAIRHGELLLLPVKTKIKEWEEKKDYIASHSETGHHHIILGISYIFNDKVKNESFLKIKDNTVIKHNKNYEAHKTLNVPKGEYKIIKKKEYDPFTKFIKEVLD